MLFFREEWCSVFVLASRLKWESKLRAQNRCFLALQLKNQLYSARSVNETYKNEWEIIVFKKYSFFFCIKILRLANKHLQEDFICFVNSVWKIKKLKGF